MRLWHSKLIPLLDGRRLCDLHMSCCNLRGMGWGKKNRNINYIYDDPLGEDALAVYHHLVLKEMERRGYKYDPLWIEADYCGKRRPRRKSFYNCYRVCCLRDVPLEAHGFNFYQYDLETLRFRGLEIKTWSIRVVDDSGTYEIYHAKRDDAITTYKVRV